jgi:hypothetical protein
VTDLEIVLAVVAFILGCGGFGLLEENRSLRAENKKMKSKLRRFVASVTDEYGKVEGNDRKIR